MASFMHPLNEGLQNFKIFQRPQMTMRVIK
jgi:hypothetical protein